LRRRAAASGFVFRDSTAAWKVGIVSENLKRKKRIGAEIEGRMLQVELT
jgi:hypothetical protein